MIKSIQYFNEESIKKIGNWSIPFILIPRTRGLKFNKT